VTKRDQTIVFTNGTAILSDKLLTDATIVTRKGKIVSVGRRKQRPKDAQVVDARGGYIGPGYIDLHVHGADGADFMDGTVDAVRVSNRCHAKHGTTTIFPTTTTGTPAQVHAMLESCAQLRDNWSHADGARIGGVHLYGPYFASEKVGCHRKDHRRDPSPREYNAYFKMGIVRIATCAAELPGAGAFYRAAQKQRCLITCGHSNSTWPQMAKAFDDGMRHVDHFWCAMSSVPSLRERWGTPMQASMEQFVLANKDMSTEVLADGFHLSPELLEFARVMKGEKRLCLVTDSNRAMDIAPGKYRFGHHKTGAWFLSDGKVGRDINGVDLASSIVGMDAMVRNMYRMTNATLPQAVRMGSLTPAERTGIARQVGSLEKGKRADILILSKQMKVRSTYLGGVRFA